MKTPVSTNFVDAVQRTGLWNLTFPVGPMIANSTIVRFDNVTQYWIDHNGHQTYHTFRDFPCLVPPFPLTWLETRPPRIHSVNAQSLFPNHYAVLLTSASPNEVGDKCPQETRWAVRADLIVESPALPIYGLSHPSAAGATHYRLNGNVWFGAVWFFLDADGRLLGNNMGDLWTCATSRPASLAPHDVTAQSIIAAAHAQGHSTTYMAGLLAPALLAVSLMHCKNVQTQLAPPLPAKWVKRYQKRHGVRPSRHRTINITPMTKIINQHAGATGQTLVQSLHICRGHFKDFRTGNGLFGKLRGRYWWNHQVRGTEATGTITHDYTVRP